MNFTYKKNSRPLHQQVGVLEIKSTYSLSQKYSRPLCQQADKFGKNFTAPRKLKTSRSQRQLQNPFRISKSSITLQTSSFITTPCWRTRNTEPETILKTYTLEPIQD